MLVVGMGTQLGALNRGGLLRVDEEDLIGFGGRARERRLLACRGGCGEYASSKVATVSRPIQQILYEIRWMGGGVFTLYDVMHDTQIFTN